MNKLIKLELKLLTKECRQSFEVLNSLLSEDFVEIIPTGQTWTKKQIIESLTSGDNQEEYEAFQIQVRNISKNTVMLNYLTKKPSQIEQQMRTSIWRKEKGKWQMIFHQGTVIK